MIHNRGTIAGHLLTAHTCAQNHQIVPPAGAMTTDAIATGAMTTDAVATGTKTTGTMMTEAYAFNTMI